MTKKMLTIRPLIQNSVEVAYKSSKHMVPRGAASHNIYSKGQTVASHDIQASAEAATINFEPEIRSDDNVASPPAITDDSDESTQRAQQLRISVLILKMREQVQCKKAFVRFQ